MVNSVKSDISFGAAQEIVLAKYWDKGVIVVADQQSNIRLKKRGGKGKRAVKLSTHPFVSNFADLITDNYDSAIDWIDRFFQGEVKIKTFKETLKARDKYAKKMLQKDKTTQEIFEI